MGCYVVGCGPEVMGVTRPDGPAVGRPEGGRNAEGTPATCKDPLSKPPTAGPPDRPTAYFFVFTTTDGLSRFIRSFPISHCCGREARLLAVQ